VSKILGAAHYDTDSSGYMSEELAYIYDASIGKRKLRGGSWAHNEINSIIRLEDTKDLSNRSYFCGFRIVRTI